MTDEEIKDYIDEVIRERMEAHLAEVRSVTAKNISHRDIFILLQDKMRIRRASSALIYFEKLFLRELQSTTSYVEYTPLTYFSSLIEDGKKYAPRSVERGIRRLLNTSWERMSIEDKEAVFGLSLSKSDYPPPLHSMITAIIQWAQRERRKSYTNMG